jgi:hypothetical protein
MNAPILSTAQWRQIDTVLLDLDGTLLDLAFDSHFWGQQVPAAWARRRELTLEQAQAALFVPSSRSWRMASAGCPVPVSSCSVCARCASGWC